MNRITHLPILSRTRVTALGIGLLAWGLVAVGPAQAQPATANLSVTATVASSCTISTAAVAFGTYNPATTHLAAPLDGTGTVTVSCTINSPVAITLGQGLTPDTPTSTADVPLRQMTSGANLLDYFLYQETGRTTVWGNTTVSDKEFLGTGVANAHTVFGRVPGAQNVPVGSYTDTVVATVTF